MNRGIESFFREAFDGIRALPGIEATLYKGAGENLPGERRIANIPRTGLAARCLGKLIRRNAYVVEQLSTFPPMIREIRKYRPDIIFYSDSNLGFQLYRRRSRIGVPYRLLFSNGGPCDPPFPRTDYVHQVAPYYFDLAVKAGVPETCQSMVPYGISVPEGAPENNGELRRSLRRSLKLPEDAKIVLSVGWISAVHKRMDYVIREVAALPAPRPHLVMLGNMDEASAAILKLADEALGSEGFTARSVPYSEVSGYYRAADVFTLGSLQEGFGRVCLEALMHGLPCAVNDHPVMRYVLGAGEVFADFSRTGALTASLAELLGVPSRAAKMAERRESVRRRFSWPVLAPAYRDMFLRCLASGPAPRVV